jgi:tRNA (adenine22-N1)-methyltransferase
LSAIAAELPRSGTVADVGTDHGMLSVYAALSGLRVVATDISAASLEKAKRLAAEYGVSDAVSFRIGDGLSVVKDGEADAVVISGMGGREIIDIINGRDFPLYILSAQRDEPLLRKYLTSACRTVSVDKTVKCSGRFYNLIVSARGAERELSEDEISFGKYFKSDPVFKERAAAELKRLKALYSSLSEDNLAGRAAVSADITRYERAVGN